MDGSRGLYNFILLMWLLENESVCSRISTNEKKGFFFVPDRGHSLCAEDICAVIDHLLS